MHEIIQEDIETILHAPLPWKKLEGKSFVISGAGGMLPAYMVHTLLKLNQKFSKKIKIYALVRNKQKLKKIPKSNNLKIIKTDLDKKIEINGKVDYVIHAASKASPKYFKKDPVGTILPNIIGTRNLLELAKRKTIKDFLYFSSGEIYGKVSNKIIKEDSFGKIDPLEIRSCYAESKKMGENMCLAWSVQHKIPIKIGRIFHSYGPGMQLNDGRVFADFVSNVVNNQDIIIKSSGKAKRPFCYITDTIIALFTILLKGKNENAYNIANPNCVVSMNELAKIMSKLILKNKTKVIKEKRTKQDNYIQTKINIQRPDITKMKSLGWKPNITIEEGFLRTIKSYL
jgi:UDP-glucuronate decarboxylase